MTIALAFGFGFCAGLFAAALAFCAMFREDEE